MPATPATPGTPVTFADWAARFDTPGDAERAELAQQVAELDHPPTISVVMPVYDTPDPLLRAAMDSVLNQWYPHWQLCVADDRSTDPQVGRTLAEYAAADSRITVVLRQENGHIAAATNSAVAVATGEWVAFLDHDDVLAPHALATVAVHLAAHPDAGLLYTDEDLVDVGGNRVAHYFKPAFDPLLLVGMNSVCHLCVVRRDLVDGVGGLRPGYEGSQDWDLVLRVTERLQRHQVVHVPRILYHWRTHPASTSGSLAAKPYAAGAGYRAAVDHLARVTAPSGDAPSVDPIPGLGWNRLRPPTPNPAPPVGIVVRTADGAHLSRCLRSIWGRTTYPDFQITVVGPGTVTPAVADLLRREVGRVRATPGTAGDGPSALANLGAGLTATDVLCFVDETVEVQSMDWLHELVGHVHRPGVGAAGGAVRGPDGRLRDAGLVLGIGGTAGPAHPGLDRLDIGYWGRAALPRQVAAVSGHCMVVRRDAWDAVGGFDDDHLPGALGDVDLCLRLADAGWATVWTPFAELSSAAEPVAAEPAVGADDGVAARYFRERWGHRLDDDPAYSPNLSLADGHFTPACPPRIEQLVVP